MGSNTVPWVRIPPSPPFWKFPGCARWGVSGALNLQPAIAGRNPFLEVKLVQAILCETAVKVGPYTAGTYKPRQVRKEAAVSRYPWVM